MALDIPRLDGQRAIVHGHCHQKAVMGMSAEEQVYKRLGSQLSHTREKRQVTQAFAGGGLALLVLGGALSLAWFGRPA